MTEHARERRPRRSFSKEYKAEVVELVRTSGKTIAAIARDMDLGETAVREWVRQADVDTGRRDELTTAEREELAALRRRTGSCARSATSETSHGFYVDSAIMWKRSVAVRVAAGHPGVDAVKRAA